MIIGDPFKYKVCKNCAFFGQIFQNLHFLLRMSAEN